MGKTIEGVEKNDKKSDIKSELKKPRLRYQVDQNGVVHNVKLVD